MTFSSVCLLMTTFANLFPQLIDASKDGNFGVSRISFALNPDQQNDPTQLSDDLKRLSNSLQSSDSLPILATVAGTGIISSNTVDKPDPLPLLISPNPDGLSDSLFASNSQDFSTSVDAFSALLDTKVSPTPSGRDESTKLALVPVSKMEEGLGGGASSGGASIQTAPEGASSGTDGVPSGDSGLGTDSNGEVNPGGFNPSAVAPGTGNTPDTRPQGSPRTRKKKKEEEDPDPGFDCSKMEMPGQYVRGDARSLMGRNPKGRYCCTQGPPTRGTNPPKGGTRQPPRMRTKTTSRCCIDYDPEDPRCFSPRNRWCGFCRVAGRAILLDAYNPYFKTVTPITKYPEAYLFGPDARKIFDSERQQEGREFWDGPQGPIKTGYRHTKATTCTPTYMASQGIVPKPAQRNRDPDWDSCAADLAGGLGGDSEAILDGEVDLQAEANPTDPNDQQAESMDDANQLTQNTPGDEYGTLNSRAKGGKRSVWV